MGRRMTLKGQISLCLAAFFLALAGQIFLSFYQSGTVLRELDDQMGNFNAISRFQNGVERSLSAMEDYRWEYGDAKALTEELHSAFSVTNAWLWRIESDLGTVSEEQYLLYNAVSTTYDSYTALVDQLEASVRRAMRQIETERKLEELAAAQPQQEQTETEEEAEDAPEEGENSQTALVMAHVRRYLEDNYMFDLSLDSVGEILHISPAYLSAQFKKYQKMNFLDCLTELRINAAKELLADPFRSSAEVASMVGYEDASYFARAFKKRTGMTPTQYRRQAGQKAKADPEAGL